MRRRWTNFADRVIGRSGDPVIERQNQKQQPRNCIGAECSLESAFSLMKKLLWNQHSCWGRITWFQITGSPAHPIVRHAQALSPKLQVSMNCDLECFLSRRLVLRAAQGAVGYYLIATGAQLLLKTDPAAAVMGVERFVH